MSTLPATAPDAAIDPDAKSSIKGRLRSLPSQFSGRFWFALALTIGVVLFAFLGPFLTSIENPDRIVGGLYLEPSAEAWLGTDNFGKDVFTQLMYGTRTSLIIGVISGLIATLIGVIIGISAGFYGGIIEEVMMGITNVVITIPSIVVLILLSIAIGSRSIYSIAIIIGVTSWPWTARAVRAQASSVRTREHVDLARLTGANTFSLMIWEVLPYMLSYIVMAFVLQLTSGILQEAALSMLGLGPSNSISLGIMLFWALLWESIRTGAWWAFVPPTIFLTLIAFTLLLLQSSLDEVFNPRLRRS
ncbi:MAG TPA: ABC transporter permease [Thermomicrobiales bacterium]|nr:ABC transporter permease [Thermomicrobiales bacterium]